MKFRYGNILVVITMLCLLASFSFADLIITEIMDGTLSSGQPTFVEITNNGVASVTLENYQISINSNGGTTWGTNRTMSEANGFPATLAPADSIVVHGNTTTFRNVWSTDIIPDSKVVYWGSMTVNGNDAVAIRDLGGTVIDIYGVFNQDGLGQAWEYTDSYANRKNRDYSATSTWNAAEWNVAPIDSLDGADAAGHRAVSNPGYCLPVVMDVFEVK